MKAAVIYFSGTGNTKRVGEVFKHYLEQMSYDVDMIDIYESKIKDYDLIIIGSPTYTMASSHNVHRYIRKQFTGDRFKKTKFITYVTHGWGTTYGHFTLRDVLRKQGLDVVGARSFLAPSNFYMFNEKIQPKQNEQEIMKLNINIQRDVARMLKDYEDQKLSIQKHSVVKKQQMKLVSNMAQNMLIKKFSSKMLSVDEDVCTQCSVCVKNCPNQNISLSNKSVAFGSDCSACARCMHICPKNAYSYKGQKFEQFKINQSSIV